MQEGCEPPLITLEEWKRKADERALFLKSFSAEMIENKRDHAYVFSSKENNISFTIYYRLIPMQIMVYDEISRKNLGYTFEGNSSTGTAQVPVYTVIDHLSESDRRKVLFNLDLFDTQL